MKFLYSIAFLALIQCLSGCSGQMPQREDTVISSSHSVHIEGGVLKILSAGRQPLLYIYVRPEVPGDWVVAGGEGGNRSSPWLHGTTIFWAAGDADGWYAADAPRKAFSCLFDSRNKTLTMESGTYA
ncbi:MAG: hypothetical protein ACE5FQ_07860, partial [Thiogranum sp.]